MDDILIIIGVLVAGSVVWFGIQIGTWMLGLRKGLTFQRSKVFLVGAMIGSPLLVAMVDLVMSVRSPQSRSWDYLISPILTGYAIALSIAGLHVAHRIVAPGRPAIGAKNYAQQAASSDGD